MDGGPGHMDDNIHPEQGRVGGHSRQDELQYSAGKTLEWSPCQQLENKFNIFTKPLLFYYGK